MIRLISFSLSIRRAKIRKHSLRWTKGRGPEGERSGLRMGKEGGEGYNSRRMTNQRTGCLKAAVIDKSLSLTYCKNA
jgi:hypothetical protein